ncbi:MAG: alginate lyase family protein [Puniceicoccaceae bacterium]
MKFALLLIAIFATSFLQAGGPRVFILNADRLEQIRGQSQEAGFAYAKGIKTLIESADAILEAGTIYSVTATGDLPPSGDIHDYYSLSPYWWPDPSKPDGLPYIRKDGETNPERDRVSDRRPVESLIDDVGILGQAYFFSGDPKYAKWAGRLLRTWFLDHETRMNPNLNHAQVRKGHNEGTAGGIIDTRRFCLLVDSIGMIENSPGWSAADNEELKHWMAEFLDWLLTSEFGKKERKAGNNHGTAYDMLVVSLALYTGDTATAKNIIENNTICRIESQIEPDGAQPQELRRTKGWNYCIENIKYFFRLANMAQHVGIDLYHYTATDGGDLKSVIDFLLPYTSIENNWPYMQITEWQPERFEVTLQIANVVYSDPDIERTIKAIGWETPTLDAYLHLPTVDPATGCLDSKSEGRRCALGNPLCAGCKAGLAEAVADASADTDDCTLDTPVPGLPPYDFTMHNVLTKRMERVDFCDADKWYSEWLGSDGQPVQEFSLHKGDDMANHIVNGRSHQRCEFEDGLWVTKGEGRWMEWEARMQVNKHPEITITIGQMFGPNGPDARIEIRPDGSVGVGSLNGGAGNVTLSPEDYVGRSFKAKMRTDGSRVEVYFNGTKMVDRPTDGKDGEQWHFRWGVYSNKIPQDAVPLTNTVTELNVSG